MMKKHKIILWSILILINMVTQTYGQEVFGAISGGRYGDEKDLFIINSDESATDASLRLQSKSSTGVHYDWNIFNYLDQRDLNFSLFTTEDHSDDDETNAGEVFMKIDGNGTLEIVNSLVVGSISDNLVPGSSMTVFGNMNITAPYSNTIPTYSDPNNYYALVVEEGIVSDDFFLANISGWADFVFDKDYALPSLKTVEDFIAKNGHLPGIPSEKEIEEKGYDLHEMNVVFLQKIEELTLHTIKQRKLLEKALKIAAKKKI